VTDKKIADEAGGCNIRSTRERPDPRGTVFVGDIKISNPQRVID